MTRRVYKRLTPAMVAKLAAGAPGSYPDGDGLYLQIAKAGSAAWVYRYMSDPVAKRERYMGLGALRHVSLSEARRLAGDARRERQAGIDPIEARRGKRLELQRQAVPAMSFRQCAEAYIAAHQVGWRSAAHARQWPATLAAYAYPVFGNLSVAAIDINLVMRVLEPLWLTKTETASRLRGRIESVLGWAMARGHRPAGDNPARWRGHLENLLTDPTAAKKAARQAQGRMANHPALPYAEIGAFMAELRRQEGVAARALEFVILTAARTGEAIGARWSEIDFAAKIWTIPGERMKAGEAHRVPLSDAAWAIVERMAVLRTSEFIFPGRSAGRPYDSGALRDVLHRLHRRDLTVHGFRSSFRDWVAEQTKFPNEVAELALAHGIKDKSEAVYRRGDLIEKRRRLAEAWSGYCSRLAPAPGQVIAIGARS
jgi:integrase